VHTTSAGCNFLRVQLGPCYNLLCGNLCWLHFFLGTTWPLAGCNLSQESCYHQVTKCDHHVTISFICCHHAIIMLLLVTYRDYYTIEYTICLGLGLKLQPSTSCSLEGLQPSSVVHGQVAPAEKLHPPRVVLSQAGKVATSCEVATKCNFELQWLQLKVVLSQLKVVPHKVYVKKNHTYYGRTTYVWTLPSTADATERVSIKAPEARTSSASTSHSTLA